MLLRSLGLTGNEGFVVGELGAGHGRLAEVFGRTTNYRYYIFDIAPALYISEWYISRIFPTERIFRFRPFDSWAQVRNQVGRSRFAFFSANQIELIPDKRLDLFINMNSLMEMQTAQITNFLAHIDRLTRVGFLSRQWLRWTNPHDGITLEKGDFALPGGWRTAVDTVDDIHPQFFNQVRARD